MSDHGHAVLRTAQSLMATRGYGWSKAVSAARDMWGDAPAEEETVEEERVPINESDEEAVE